MEQSSSTICRLSYIFMTNSPNCNVLQAFTSGRHLARLDGRPGCKGFGSVQEVVLFRRSTLGRPLLRVFALFVVWLVAIATLSAQQADPSKTPNKTSAENATATADQKAKDGKKSDGSPSHAVPEASQSVVPPGYRVGADDELAISVWHEPELSQVVVVRPDGMITMPLLNDIHVAGLTTEGLQTLLTEKLKALVNDPQVTVIVKAVKSQKIFVVGAVAKQGAYPLGGDLTVLQVIAQAGGVGPFAKTRGIYILRNRNGKQVKIPFNYKKALAGKDPDPILQSGDMIVVP